VEADDLGALLRGANPKGGVLRASSQPDSVSGFDLTFRAPKSVSILFGIGDDRVVAAAREAHDAAVIDALAYMERAACRTRRGKGGVQRVRGRGFVAAAFRHRTSRAGDPQLHTHVVIGNLAEGPDGRWTALDGRLLYKHAKTAGYLYQASLRPSSRSDWASAGPNRREGRPRSSGSRAR
jgi:conjugative relaxase-like TrwC/TraI family protein